MTFLIKFFALLIGHAFADFAFQNDYMARHKARLIDYDYASSQRYNKVWFWVLGSHSLIHGGAVWMITGIPFLGLAETGMHFLIDFLKTEGMLHHCRAYHVDCQKAYHYDQILHVFCKACWVLVWVVMS